MPAPIASERHRRPSVRALSLAHRAIGCLAVALLALARPDDLHAQVTSIDVGKSIAYEQVSASSVVPASLPYAFEAGVRGPNLESLSPVPTLSGPAFSSPLTYRPDPTFPSWTVSEFFSDKAALEARAPDGTYTITVNGTPVPLQLAGDLYPNPPLLTLSGGAWSGGKFYFDPGRPLTITTNAFADYARFKGVIFLGSSQQFFVNNPTNSMSVTVPAGTYAAGQEFSLNVQFSSFTHENVTALPGIYAAATYAARTRVRLVAQPQPQPPVFEMTVRTNITPTLSSASADIQFRPQDVGTAGSVFAFAVAPATRVMKSASAEAPFVVRKSLPASGKDTPVACVLAQLNSSGQLQAVSASQLQAYVSGVLSAQGQSVSILENVPTANVAGATFYVGYGSSPAAMINEGINRSVVTVPGEQQCQPAPPQTGWWWNPAEDGRGYTVEVSGHKLFVAAYLYDVSGRSTWYISAGNTSLDGSLFVGDLESYSNGQTLSGPFRSPVRPPVLNGKITLAFSDSTHGTLTWPGGTVPITRMEYGVGGVNAVPQANQPENGWWLSGLDDGRGFFIEWQAGTAFMAGFMYDDTGAPVWYIAAKPRTDNAQVFSSNWESYVNGQTLTGAYRPPVRPPTLVGPATIQFQGAADAIMTMPGGRQVTLSRYRF